MAEHDKAGTAHPKVEAITAFYIHLSVFLVVIGILVAVNLVTTTNWWVQYPFLGWGIGILAHAFAVFGRMPAFVTRWQLRKIRDIKETM